MATYLYCVLAPPKIDAFPTGLTGIAGAPVRTVVSRRDDGLEAWVATIDDATMSPSGRALAEQALMHNDVVEAALATGRTPLPARFGSRFVDDMTCLARLNQHENQLSAALSRVAGAVEMSVLLVPIGRSREALTEPPQRDEPSAGRRYLEAVRERTRSNERRRAAADNMCARITSSVAAIVRGETHNSGSSEIVSLAHLVDLRDLERYRHAVADVAPDGVFRIVVAGPRAPYSFAAEARAVAGHDSSSPSRNE